MRILRSLAGVLLGAVLVVFGAETAASAEDNCLLILCVDAPVVGPVVGGVGDGLEDVLSPESPREEPAPEPMPQQPAPAPVPRPQQPPAPAPEAPAEPGYAPEQAPTAPSAPGGSQSPESVTPGPSPTPSVSPSSGTVYDFDRDGIQDDPDEVELLRLHPLTPFLLSALVVLFAAISISAVGSLISRRKRREAQNTSVLPRG